MSKEDAKKFRDEVILSDSELAKVAGGGYYWRVKGCPHGYTKFVNWILTEDIAGKNA